SSFDGFALNVRPDLGHFDWIHPCGIRHLGVGSLRTLLGEAPPRREVLARLRESFAGVWHRPVVEAPCNSPVQETLLACRDLTAEDPDRARFRGDARNPGR